MMARRRWSRKANKALGKAGNQRGTIAEKRTLAILCELKAAKWLQKFRPATSKENRNGWDIVAETDRGNIGIQVKCSPRAASVVRAKTVGVAAISAGERATEGTVRSVWLQIISIREFRGLEWGGEITPQHAQMLDRIQRRHRFEITPGNVKEYCHVSWEVWKEAQFLLEGK